MSRIGRMPVPVPAGVDVTIDGRHVRVKGPKGELSHTVAEPISVERGDDGGLWSPGRTTSGSPARCTACPARCSTTWWSG